jgi:enamine deaminase RidA (YjgF/YER057c/UK114 family)
MATAAWPWPATAASSRARPTPARTAPRRIRATPRRTARAVFEIIGRALREAGFELADVVRTRMFVTETEHITPVTTVHGEVFREVRPAATVVVVKALIDPTLLVEIEVDARRS